MRAQDRAQRYLDGQPGYVLRQGAGLGRERLGENLEEQGQLHARVACALRWHDPVALAAVWA